MTASQTFSTLPELASHLRKKLEEKKFVLLYAYNGTGKTRLSMSFKDLGKKTNDDGETIERDTLYFNAFTEDLFQWENDFEGDNNRYLKINKDSYFVIALFGREMESKIRSFLECYADFDFFIDTDQWTVSFSRSVNGENLDNIKVSRGEERIFILSFFLAIVQLVIDEDEAFEWVRYFYIDDPISSLDENNAILVAHHLSKLLIKAPDKLKAIVSTHHTLFFNVMSNEWNTREEKSKIRKYFLNKDSQTQSFALSEVGSRPFLYHINSLVNLDKAERSGETYTYHFNVLRRVMEQTACFLGYSRWEECLKTQDDDPNQTVYKRFIDVMNHGDYALFEPEEMGDVNKELFSKALRQFIQSHPFNRKLFPDL